MKVNTVETIVSSLKACCLSHPSSSTLYLKILGIVSFILDKGLLFYLFSSFIRLLSCCFGSTTSHVTI